MPALVSPVLHVLDARISLCHSLYNAAQDSAVSQCAATADDAGAAVAAAGMATQTSDQMRHL